MKPADIAILLKLHRYSLDLWAVWLLFLLLELFRSDTLFDQPFDGMNKLYWLSLAFTVYLLVELLRARRRGSAALYVSGGHVRETVPDRSVALLCDVVRVEIHPPRWHLPRIWPFRGRLLLRFDNGRTRKFWIREETPGALLTRMNSVFDAKLVHVISKS